MKVRVLGTYQVVHEGDRYVGGDEFDAPDGEAQQWVNNGWAEKVSAKKSEPKAQDSADNKAQTSSSNKAASSRSADSK